MTANRFGRSAGVVTLLIGLSSPAPGHEIKVFASQQEAPAPGVKTTVYLSWGHRLPVDGLTDAATLERYEVVAPDGTAAPLKAADTSLQANVVELKQPGVYRVAVARKAGVITYVIDAEGKRQMKRGPKSAITEGKIDSASRTTHDGVALVLVGTPGTEPPKPVGLPVEAVPLDGPAKWAAGADLKFLVLVEGKPAASATVEVKPVGHKPDDAWPITTAADANGEVTVRADRAGTWVIRASLKRQAPDSQRAQYDTESFTGTLTLEVRP